MAVGDGVRVKRGSVDVGVAGGGVGVAVSLGSPVDAQIVRPSFVSHPCDASARSMAAFSALSSNPLDPLPPAHANRTQHSATSHAHRDPERAASFRFGGASCGASAPPRATQNGVAVIRTLRKRLSRDGSPANSSASARTAASRRWWNSGSRAGSMLR